MEFIFSSLFSTSFFTIFAPHFATWSWSCRPGFLFGVDKWFIFVESGWIVASDWWPPERCQWQRCNASQKDFRRKKYQRGTPSRIWKRQYLCYQTLFVSFAAYFILAFYHGPCNSMKILDFSVVRYLPFGEFDTEHNEQMPNFSYPCNLKQNFYHILIYAFITVQYSLIGSINWFVRQAICAKL